MPTSHNDADAKRLIEATRGSSFLKLTLHQLRDYVALYHTRNQGRAATLTGRDDSRVRGSRKAVKTAIGEVPFVDVERKGAELGITEAGNLFLKHAEKILWDVFALTREMQKPRRVRLALTNYMTEVPFVRQILQQAQTKLEGGLILTQIASHEVKSVLLGRLADFVFSGTLAANGDVHGLDRRISFQPFKEVYRIGLLSTYHVSATAEAHQLLRDQDQQECLLPPTHGIFLEALETVLTTTEIKNLPGLRSDDIHFALDVLRFKLKPKACIVVDENVANITMKRSMGKLFFVPFRNGLAVHTGVFRLKEMFIPTGRRPQPKPARSRAHPLQIFEDILLEHVGTARR